MYVKNKTSHDPLIRAPAYKSKFPKKSLSCFVNKRKSSEKSVLFFPSHSFHFEFQMRYTLLNHPFGGFLLYVYISNICESECGFIYAAQYKRRKRRKIIIVRLITSELTFAYLLLLTFSFVIFFLHSLTMAAPPQPPQQFTWYYSGEWSVLKHRWLCVSNYYVFLFSIYKVKYIIIHLFRIFGDSHRSQGHIYL